MKPTLSLILLTNRSGGVRSIEVNPRRATLLALIAITMLCGGILYSGFHLGLRREARRQLAEVAALQTLYRQQGAEITRARETARASLDALTLRLGRMKARLLRLDALGTELVTQADFDATEFDFSNPPPVGGPRSTSTLPGATVADFLDMLDELDTTVDDREAKLTVLERLLMRRSLRARITPSGRATEHGLLSSPFGKRVDPFTGKLEQHKGIDIAGKEGSDVMALGDGVVIWSGKRAGYGNLVEINHGRGYITRYGHNKKLLVRSGDIVRKGQTIALMGSTGRSTGPHVHIEVVQNGEPVDPAEYLNNQEPVGLR
jgi:murein DD-endopeptidase MepM/ murein hydrolase activator NlpD